MHKFTKTLAAAAAIAALASPSAFAADGDTLTYLFNAASAGNAVATINQATLVLTDTATGVDFTLSPNWGVTTGNRVDQLVFAYSGEAMSFANGAGPQPTYSVSGAGTIDSGYTTTAITTVAWPSSPNNGNFFDASDPFSSWSINGANVDLSDFMVLATATSTKPTPSFGVISMPGASPSNWVAGEADGVVVPSIPEPETYALMLAGLAAMGFVARRRKI